MTALPGARITTGEVATFMDCIALLTNYRVIRDPDLGHAGVEINFDTQVIRINGYLDPVAVCQVLLRAYRRIGQGPDSDPAFRTKLRLVV